MKPKPTSSMQRRDLLGPEVDPGPERLQHVGRPAQPGGGAVAVLGQRAARAGGDQRRGGRDVEGRPARRRSRRCRRGRRARSARGSPARASSAARPASSSVVSPFVRSAMRKPAICVSEASPRMISARTSLVSAHRQVLALGERSMAFVRTGLGKWDCRRGSSAAGPVRAASGRTRVELDAFDGKLSVTDAHDHASAGRGDVEAVGQVGGRRRASGSAPRRDPAACPRRRPGRRARSSWSCRAPAAWRTTLAAERLARSTGGRGRRPRVGTPCSGKRSSRSTQTPASFGVHGPGETTTRSGTRSSSSSTSATSLRTTSSSAPSSPRYWTRL